MNRHIKIGLAAFASLFCLFYAFQNLANLGPAEWFVGTMTAMEGHEAYPNTFAFAIKSPILVKIMLWIIILLELAAGLLAGKGAFDLFRDRNGSSDEFNNAKTFALAGTSLGVIIWFGIFGAFGGAFFQMWQNEAGLNALRDASFYALQLGEDDARRNTDRDSQDQVAAEKAVGKCLDGHTAPLFPEIFYLAGRSV